MSDVITGVQPAEEFALTPAAAGDAAFDAVFREHYPRVVGMLARLTGDRGQAEEIAADVFCKLSRRKSMLQHRDQWMPWLYRVATNAGLDALRSNARRKRREEIAGTQRVQVEEASALDGMLREERAARVRDVLSSLRPREAQMLLLRADGLAYRELAETLGIQPGSVGTLLARAESEFERRFRARYGGDV
jgi:RNA polymerase sigma-70 factor, ECF subfamily